jgi:hypothetical protein
MTTRGTCWVTEPHQEIDIQLGEGFAAIRPRTVAEVLTETVGKHGQRQAMCLKRPVNVSFES